MAVGFYADVHVPGPVILQLRLRNVDILAATEDGNSLMPDEKLLALATSLQRITVTQDIRFRVRAESWHARRKGFLWLDLCAPAICQLRRNDF